MLYILAWLPEAVSRARLVRLWAPLGRLPLLPESDPAPVVEFFTRTGITAAGGQHR
jgi:hypothetical protein